jgi:uncharacterized membrane protein YdbT with pleckstrin-like domain
MSRKEIMTRAANRLFYGFKLALALPVYQILNLATYAAIRNGWLARVATFGTFLPIVVITTVCWAGLWSLALTAIWQFFK